MPDFTVIEGGGSERKPGDRETNYARQSFRRLVVEILRALARGNDSGLRIVDTMRDFNRHALEASASAGLIVDDEIRALSEVGLRQEFDNTSSDDRKAILRAALRVVAESLADDPAAKGRLSKRDGALDQSIEEYVLERERRTRANGWSYTKKLTASLGRWSPPPKPKAAPVRKPRRPKAK